MLCQGCLKGGRPPRKGRGSRAPGQAPKFVSGRVRVGLHARNADDFTPLDYEIIRRANVETLKMMSQTRVEVYKQLRESFPNLEFIVRLRDERIGGNRDSGQSWHPSASEFVTRFVPVITSLRPYATKIEIHNEPNHVDLYEGWKPSLESASDFNKWFVEVYRGLKQACPWAEFGFPGLALHPNGLRSDLEWAKTCAEAIKVADWLGVHCYWQYDNIWSLDWGFYFVQYHKLFPDKKIEITEFGNSTPKLDHKVMAREYTQYYNEIQRHGVYLRSASAFIATSPHAEWQEFCWGKSEDNRCYPVVDNVRTVNRPQAIDEGPIDRVPGIVEKRFLLPSRKDAGFYQEYRHSSFGRRCKHAGRANRGVGGHANRTWQRPLPGDALSFRRRAGWRDQTMPCA